MPATSTTSDAPEGEPEAAVDGGDAPGAAEPENGGAGDPEAAICTAAGSERWNHRPAPARVRTTTTMSPTSSPRESESRRSLMGMRGTLGRGGRSVP